jgi:hypothetical protein
MQPTPMFPSLCENFFITPKMLCECRGMRLRASPHCGRIYKDKFRAKKRDSVGIQRNYRLGLERT